MSKVFNCCDNATIYIIRGTIHQVFVFAFAQQSNRIVPLHSLLVSNVFIVVVIIVIITVVVFVVVVFIVTVSSRIGFVTRFKARLLGSFDSNKIDIDGFKCQRL